MDPKIYHEDLVRKFILATLRSGESDFVGILSNCYGADPRLVNKILNKLCGDSIVLKKNTIFSLIINPYLSANWPKARADILSKLEGLPGANPLAYQWWFDVGTLTRLAKFVWRFVTKKPPAFLGTPILGYFYSSATGRRCSVLDIDKRILNALDFETGTYLRSYDVADELPRELIMKHSVVVIDPPWYAPLFDAFLARSRALAEPSGILLCVLPGFMTRPKELEQRNILIGKFQKNKYKIISIEQGVIGYTVPVFEARAYDNIKDFDVRSWRNADLLITIFPDEWNNESPGKCIFKSDFKDYCRGRKRIFLRRPSKSSKICPIMKEDLKFSLTVSEREAKTKNICLWTNERKGYYIRNYELFNSILKLWEKGEKYNDVLNKLKKKNPNAEKLLRDINLSLELWSEKTLESPLMHGKQLEKAREDFTSKWASSPSIREYECIVDHFRLSFQRDRDRIMWSKSFKRLAAKTQVFPVEHDVHIRRRLTHSITVSQLALTVARAFGLDPDLTEAIALAHDIGHTPFGHAGEEAIDSFLQRINKKWSFNHYEHGVDVLRWLEDAYLSPAAGDHPGLNLCSPVYEGVFKHMYYKSCDKRSQDNLYKRSKHTDQFENDFCHLEGQAVRIADKISYMIEDIEDGIRAGILSLEQLLMVRLFNHPLIDLQKASSAESDLDRFISQRRAILSIIMSDLLQETNRILSRIRSARKIRTAKHYCVQLSPNLLTDMREVWHKLQKGILFKDKRVQQANVRAERVIKELLILLTFYPDTMDKEFKNTWSKICVKCKKYIEWYKDHRVKRRKNKILMPKEFICRFISGFSVDKNIEFYRNMCQVPIRNIIMAKDYVASLTDDKALRIYREYIQGKVSLY